MIIRILEELKILGSGFRGKGKCVIDGVVEVDLLGFLVLGFDVLVSFK